MLKHIRLLTGISVFWLALSMLFDGVNTLVLPLQLSRLANQNNQATILGLVTFVGLLAGAVVQPIVGLFSDRLQPFLGRNRFIGIGLILSLTSLFFFAVFQSMIGVLLSYLAIQVSASIAQAGQQALIPDLVEEGHRGLASGLKGFMDLTGAMLGFAILGQLLGSDQRLLAIGSIAATLVIAYIIAIMLTPEDRPLKNAVVKTSTTHLGAMFRFDLDRQSELLRMLAARFLFLLGIYGIGRFLLLFVAERLGLSPEQAAEQAGNLLAVLALITILASPIIGVIHIAPERGAIRQRLYTGSLWRVRQADGPQGLTPPKPAAVPIYLLQGLALLIGTIGIGVISARLIRKARGNNK